MRDIMRQNGLETQLLQRRLLAAWDDVAGPVVAQYTETKEIKNQTLWVKIANPAVRQDLQMCRTALVDQLNAKVGTRLIAEIKVY